MKRIKLSGKHSNLHTIVDDQDFWLSQYPWHLVNGYAGQNIWVKRTKVYYKIYLHHAIMGFPLNDLEIDHINRNKLDNRQCNLRIVSRFVNMTNQEACWGEWDRNVYEDKRGKAKPFYVQCSKNRQRVHGGSFVTLEEAQAAAAALRKQLGYAEEGIDV